MNVKTQVIVFGSESKLLEQTVNTMATIAKDAIATRGKFSLVLSGGRTPDELYKLLSMPQQITRLPWDRTDVFWGDERYVPEDDKRNNAFVAHNLLLSRVPIAESQIHRIPVRTDPTTDATNYEKTVRDYFNDAPSHFDLIFLGLGENGHTASLFPHTQVLHEKERLVKEVYVDEVGMHRITMCRGLINRARNIIFLLQGGGKAEVLNQVLTGPYQPEVLPAQLIRPVNGNLFWFTDEPAAAKLPEDIKTISN